MNAQKPNSLSAALDGMLKSLFIEGMLGLAPHTASTGSAPMRNLEHLLGSSDPKVLDALRAGGWFDSAGQDNLYAVLHRSLDRAASRHNRDFADEALSDLMLRPATDRADTRSLVYVAGAMLNRADVLAGRADVARAAKVLYKIAWNKQVDLARSACPKHTKPSGLVPQLAYAVDAAGAAEVGSEPASISGTLLDALSDPQDPVGVLLGKLMMRVARAMYAKWRRPYAVPPMIKFIEQLRTRTFVSCTALAREYEIADTSLRQRHLKPFVQHLSDAAQTWKHRATVAEALHARGCSLDDAEEWASGWSTHLASRQSPQIAAPEKMPPLDEQQLRRLYPAMTDADIAARYSLTDAYIGRLRQTWGIPTSDFRANRNIPRFAQDPVALQNLRPAFARTASRP